MSGSPLVLFLLLLSQELILATVFDLYKQSMGPPNLSRGLLLMSNPEARELQFSRKNLGNWLVDIFADRLADICNASSSSSDKVCASLSIYTLCSAIAELRLKPNPLVNQKWKFSCLSLAPLT
jgi:hypothetical protein